MKVSRAFRKAINIELYGRESDRSKYIDLLNDIGYWLDVEPQPLNISADSPPQWVRDFPELAFLWDCGHAAYRERIERRRRSA